MRHLGRAILCIVVLAVVALPAVVAASGKVYFYIDKDNSGTVSAGDVPAPNTPVYCMMRLTMFGWTSPPLYCKTMTGSQGAISLSQAAAGDKLFCKYQVYSQTSNKIDRAFAGSLFDLYMTTDKMSANGDSVRRELTAAEANTINSGGSVVVLLDHPVFEWNLVVALNWNADADYLAKLKNGFRQASNYLFDVTDGYMKLGRIDVRNNVSESSWLWCFFCDVRVDAKWDGEWTGVMGAIDYPSYPFVSSMTSIHMPRYHAQVNDTIDSPDGPIWPRALIHELGHYALAFGDEYRNGQRKDKDWGVYRKAHPYQVPKNYGLMDGPTTASEMSASHDYLQTYAGFQVWQMTSQIWEHTCKSGGIHFPCWEWMRVRFANPMGGQLRWSDYDGYRFDLYPPPYGFYKGLICGPTICIEDQDASRPAPAYFFPLCLGCYSFAWKECEFGGAVSGAATQSDTVCAGPPPVDLTVTAANGKPVAGARVWCETASGRRIEQGRTDRGGRITCVGAAKGDRLCAFSGSGMAVTTVDGASAAVRFADGPRANQATTATLDAYVSAVNSLRFLTITLTASQTLEMPPTVEIRPGFETPVGVSMHQSGPRTYTGTAPVDTSVSGSIDAWLDAGHTTLLATTTFQILQYEPGYPAAIPGPDGLFEACFPDGGVGAETLAMSLGNGTAPAPPTSSLVALSEPVSFHLQNNQTSQMPFTINWIIRPNMTAGFDANTVRLYRYDTARFVWTQVDCGYAPEDDVLTASNVLQGTYALFAQQSSDITPPGVVIDLTAETAPGGGGVVLHWTATGDDANMGQAARYRLWYKADPGPSRRSLDPPAQSVEMPLRAQPQPAGTAEAYAINMPDPNTVYYFQIQAEDEAGNTGPLSNQAAAISYAPDTDGDGIPDLYEQTYGLNPNDPDDAAEDPDGDGLANFEESVFGTDPFDADTDGDGLTDGLEVAASTSPTDAADPVTAEGQAVKGIADGTLVGCPYLVTTAAFVSDGYAETPNRTFGIRLIGSPPAPNKLIEVIGNLGTEPNDERCMYVAAYRERGSASAAPLGMTCRALGGGALQCDPVFGIGQKGIDGAVGLNNIGLLVRVSGAVTAFEPVAKPTWFTINDGSVEVKCVVPAAVTIGQGWQRVLVTGISSCEKVGGKLCRLIRVRDAADITAYP